MDSVAVLAETGSNWSDTTAGANQYRIAVNKFATGVSTVVPPTIVTAANIVGIKNAIASTVYTGGSTNTASAISNLTSLFVNAGGLNSTALFNITTDGASNNQTATETASLNAFNAGVDGLSYEAIGGLSASTIENMRRSAALGTNGNTLAASAIVTNNSANFPNPLTTGFVLTVTDFAGYSAAINAKVQRIVNPDPDPNVVPLPAGMPLLLAGMGVFAFMRRRKAAA